MGLARGHAECAGHHVPTQTIWPFVAAGIAPLVAALKDWLFGHK